VSTKFYTIDDLAQILHLSTKTIRNNRSNYPHRVPPAIQIGKRLLWDCIDVEKWLNNQSRSSSSRPRKKGRPKKYLQLV
jgi:predicted DNA-binding transcriptional regulator AlpA